MKKLIQVIAPLWKNGNFTEIKYKMSHREEGLECTEDSNGLTAHYIQYVENDGHGPSHFKSCWVLRMTETQARGARMYLRARYPEISDEQLEGRFFHAIELSMDVSQASISRLGLWIVGWFLIAVLINAAILIAEEKNPSSGLIQFLVHIRLWLAFGAGGAVFALSRIPHRKRKAELAFFRDGSAETICAKIQEMEI